jgi:parallel beta helix pectate lyase-like protein
LPQLHAAASFRVPPRVSFQSGDHDSVPPKLDVDRPSIRWRRGTHKMRVSPMSSVRRLCFGRAAAIVFFSALGVATADARPARPAPPLAPPSGAIVNVSTEPQLRAAIRGLTSNTTIVLAAGTYILTSTVWINGTFTNVGIRGATGNSDDVMLVGPGMAQPNHGNVPFGIWTGGNVQGVTIANLTIRDVYYHPLIFNGGTRRPHVYNVRLVDGGEQLLKANPDAAGHGVDDGVVEYSIFEYRTTARSYYTNGVDVVGGRNWTIRHNLFRNIVAPRGQLAGPAVLMWKGTANTVAEGNAFVNCARGIAYGLGGSGTIDHSGGVIRNNFFSRTATEPGDVGIYLGDSPNTQVLNNTVILSGTYSAAIEYRFAATTGASIVNNLSDTGIVARDRASASVRNNLTGATTRMFVDAAAGDLHLSASAAAAIDHGETLSAVTDDWDGAPRPQGAAYDIGADERGTAPNGGATAALPLLRLALVIHPEQLDDELHVGVGPNRHAHPSGIRQHMVRPRFALDDQSIAYADRKWKIGEPVAVEVAQLAAADAELDAAESMSVDRHAVPAAYLACNPFGSSRGFLRLRSHTGFDARSRRLVPDTVESFRRTGADESPPIARRPGCCCRGGSAAG